MSPPNCLVVAHNMVMWQRKMIDNG